MTQTALCRQCSNCQNVFTQGLLSMLQHTVQQCAKVVVELPQYCIVLMTAKNCSVDIVYTRVTSAVITARIFGARYQFQRKSTGQQNQETFTGGSVWTFWWTYSDLPHPFPSYVYLKSKDIFTEHKLCCSVGQKINMTKMMLVDWCWSFCWSYLSFHVDVPAVCLLRSSFFSTRIIWYKLILIATNGESHEKS